MARSNHVIVTMGGKSSKNNSWDTPQQPIQEISRNMPNSDMYESSIKWQPPYSVQNDAPTYINQHPHDIPNGAYGGSSLYYNQPQVSVKPTNQSLENSYANPVQTTAERFSAPTQHVEKSPKEQGKKTPKSQGKIKEKDVRKSSEESSSVTTFPDVHLPRAKFDREWYMEQLQERKHLQESVYEAFPENDEGRVGYNHEREEPHMNRAKDRSDSNPGIYTNKDKANRPLLYQGSKQHDNVSLVKTSRGNSQSGVDPYSAKYPSKESEASHPKPTALVQVLPSEPFEIRNLKRHQVHRGSPQNNNYFPEPDYNENRKSDWDFEYPSAEGIPEADY